MKRALIALIVLAGACAAMPPPDAPPAAQEDTCGLAAYAHLIGKPASEIDPASLPPRARILTPDAIVTMDFSPDRLNVILGTDGKVGSLRCF